MMSRTLRYGSSISRRSFSTSDARVGQLKVRKKGVPGSSGSAAAPPVSRVPPPITPPSEIVEITHEIQRNNLALAGTLIFFCGSVTWYSIYAVGRSASLDGNSEDPVAALQREAEAAQAKKLRENQEMADAEEMIKQAQSGAFDPDNFEGLEEEASAKRSKKAWWKFW